MTIKISVPLDTAQIKRLKAGDEVLLSGTIYTARDQAHKKLVEIIRSKKRLPFEMRGAVVYYCGPTRTPRGRVIGSCGPTTASRMDAFTPALLIRGLKGIIGKGRRSLSVVKALKEQGGVYFLAYAGCGALITRYVKKARVIAFKELGPEAVRSLEVEDFPLIVAVDARGNSIYG
ncbi:MAG: FumA C-terminus/TtdB family hydratase beta subunit [Candidatus Omnitrophica bacterium]|nr:FumA C-terminus/TtdB family hydratase beta subunit [Candidatus Omnitrophota bacterium]